LLHSADANSVGSRSLLLPRQRLDQASRALSIVLLPSKMSEPRALIQRKVTSLVHGIGASLVC